MRVERYIVKNKKKSKANSDKVDKKPSGKGKKGVKPKGAKDAKDIFIPGKKPKKDGKKKEFSGVKSTTKKTVTFFLLHMYCQTNHKYRFFP